MSSYTSKFTERFDIDPSDSNLLEIPGPPSPLSPKSCPVFYSPELDISSPSINSQGSSKAISIIGIPIPQKKKNAISTVTPPCSPPQSSEKHHHDDLASRFKKIVNSISKKKK